MKIAEIHIFQVDLPVKDGPYTMSGTSLDAVDTTLIKLVTDSGQIGWGETCPLGSTYAPAHSKGARAALDQMAPGLIGTDAAVRPAQYRMDQLLAGHNYAKAAIDIAVHDALARALNIPVTTLLGGAVRTRLPAYYAIGLKTPEMATSIAKAKIAEGFRRLQLKVGRQDPKEDIAVITRVSEVAGPAGVQLVVDANRGWRVAEAIKISQACRDIPMVIEQPCDTLSEIRQLRPHLCHLLYLDEAVTDLDTALLIMAEGLADGFGLKLTRMGGLSAMTTMRDMLAARNLPHTCDDSWGSDIIAAACVHMAATVLPAQLDGVWTAGSYINSPIETEGAVTINNGFIDLPAGPGLGVWPNEKALGAPVAVYQ